MEIDRLPFLEDVLIFRKGGRSPHFRLCLRRTYMKSGETMTSIGERSAESVPVKKFRVQLDFEDADFQAINNLVDELGLKTRAELFRSGLRVLRWMMLKKQMGCTIVAITPDERYIEPDFEFFKNIGPPKDRRHVPGSNEVGTEEEVHA